MSTFKTWLSRAGTLCLVLFVALILWRMFVLERTKQTAVQVEKIHSTKLTMDDVMGKNLPAKPANPDSTIAGVDVNKNGIRDDVELAIFATYPNSAKTRAVLLQYALALQMDFTQQLVDTGTVSAVAEEESRGYLCIGDITSRDNMENFIAVGDKLHKFVESKMLNTQERKNSRQEFFSYLRSGDVPNQNVCDVDLSKLLN